MSTLPVMYCASVPLPPSTLRSSQLRGCRDSMSKATSPKGSRHQPVLASLFTIKDLVLKATCFEWVFLLQFLPASVTNLSTSADFTQRQFQAALISSLSLHLLRLQIKHLCATSPQHPGTHKPEQPMFPQHFALPFSPEDLWDV